MAISELDRKRIDVWCAAQIATGQGDEVRIDATYRGNTVTICERRRPGHPSLGAQWLATPVARLSWQPELNIWTLFAPGPTGRMIEYTVGDEGPSSLADLLEEIQRDPSEIFWG